MGEVLQKLVCRDCMEKTCPVNGLVLRATGKMAMAEVPVGWREYDDSLWEEGKVLCPKSMRAMEWQKARNVCDRVKGHVAVEGGALMVVEEKKE